jgi:hypothetical protein
MKGYTHLKKKSKNAVILKKRAKFYILSNK